MNYWLENLYQIRETPYFGYDSPRKKVRYFFFSRKKRGPIKFKLLLKHLQSIPF